MKRQNFVKDVMMYVNDVNIITSQKFRLKNIKFAGCFAKASIMLLLANSTVKMRRRNAFKK